MGCDHLQEIKLRRNLKQRPGVFWCSMQPANIADYDLNRNSPWQAAAEANSLTQFIERNEFEHSDPGGGLALMAKEEGGPAIRANVLFWPVTNANFENASYDEFAEGHFLTRPMMKWFWDAYTTNPSERQQIYASPCSQPRSNCVDFRRL